MNDENKMRRIKYKHILSALTGHSRNLIRHNSNITDPLSKLECRQAVCLILKPVFKNILCAAQHIKKAAPVNFKMFKRRQDTGIFRFTHFGFLQKRRPLRSAQFK